MRAEIATHKSDIAMTPATSFALPPVQTQVPTQGASAERFSLLGENSFDEAQRGAGGVDPSPLRAVRGQQPRGTDHKTHAAADAATGEGSTPRTPRCAVAGSHCVVRVSRHRGRLG